MLRQLFERFGSASSDAKAQPPIVGVVPAVHPFKADQVSISLVCLDVSPEFSSSAGLRRLISFLHCPLDEFPRIGHFRWNVFLFCFVFCSSLGTSVPDACLIF